MAQGLKDLTFEEKVERIAGMYNTFFPGEYYTGEELLEFMESNVVARTQILHMIIMVEEVEDLKQDEEEMKKSFVQLDKMIALMDKGKGVIFESTD